MKEKPSKIIDGILCFQCTKCNKYLPKEDFVKNSKTTTGISSLCKECKRKASNKNRCENNYKKKVKYFMNTRNLTEAEAIDYMNNREKLNRKPRDEKIIDGEIFRRCNTCLKYKPKSEYRVSHYSCIECEKNKKKEYYIANRERHRKKCEEWHKENRAKEKDYYQKNSWRIKTRIRDYCKTKTNEYGYNRDYFHIKARKFKKENGINFDKCSICDGEGDIIMHHPSYESKDMREFIVPVCAKCHINIHNGFIECPPPVKLTDLAKYKNKNDTGKNIKSLG